MSPHRSLLLLFPGWEPSIHSEVGGLKCWRGHLAAEGGRACRETQPQVWERPSAAGQPRGERAESRSVTQEMEREINEHTGAGAVTFQERGKEECNPCGRGSRT